MKKLIIAIPLLWFTLIQAQVYNNSTLSVGIFGGVNRCILAADTTGGSPALTPIAGVHLSNFFSPNFLLNLGGQFTAKGTDEVEGIGNIRNYYADAYAGLQYNVFKYLSFGTGVQPSFLISSTAIEVSGQNATGKETNDIEGFDSALEYYLETQLKMNSNLFLGVKYFLPFGKSEFKRIEFRLLYNMVEGYYRIRK